MSYLRAFISVYHNAVYHKKLYDLIMIANRRAQRERSKAEGDGMAE